MDPLTSEGFAELLTKQLRSEIKIFPARAHHPSQLGHPCLRFLTWRATRWSEQKPHGETLQSVFDQGRDFQPIVYRKLEALGYEIVRESDRPREHRTRSGAVISGLPDGRIIGFRGEKIAPSRILEIKTMSDHVWEKLDTLDDIRNAEQHYIRGYYSQGHVYAFLEELPGGVFVLYNKLTGLMKLIPFELDYEHAEECLQKIEVIQPMIDAKIDPPPMVFQWRVCGSCGFLDNCYPAKDFGQGAAVIDDQAFIAQIAEWMALKKDAAEYEKLDKDVKAQLRHRGIKQAVAGPYVIEGKEVDRKQYTVAAGKYVRYTIEQASKAAEAE